MKQGQKIKRSFLEGDGHGFEKVVQEGGRDNLKVAYTNVNGLTSSILELECQPLESV